MVEFSFEFAGDDGMLPAAMTTLLLATRNRHKTAEIRGILGKDFAYLTLHDFPDAPRVAEDADTFVANAVKKAVALARWLGAKPDARFTTHALPCFVLADDSGLEVDALNGAPGVHSARFAALDAGRAGNCSDAENNAKLLRLLKDVPAARRTARFRCVVAAVTVGRPPSVLGPPQLFEGVCEGRLGFAPRGHNGFGYDPLFIPAGFTQTFAELGDATKNTLSHRGKALAALRAALLPA
jgi:XTP/dITP diphosphohydrolase